MKALIPHLIFNGNCEEALNFYKEVLKGDTIGNIIRYKEAKETQEIPKDFENKILKAHFMVENVLFLASDASFKEKYTKGNNLYLTLECFDEEQAKETFQLLAQEGQVIFPIKETSFSFIYGKLTDRFGVNWIITV